MFEKPRLGTFSRFLAPSIDNSQACYEVPTICSLFLPSFSFKIVSFFRLSSLSLSSSPVYTCRRVVGTRTSVHNTEMYRERKLTITGPPRAFIAHLGGVAYHRHLVSHD